MNFRIVNVTWSFLSFCVGLLSVTIPGQDVLSSVQHECQKMFSTSNVDALPPTDPRYVIDDSTSGSLRPISKVGEMLERSLTIDSYEKLNQFALEIVVTGFSFEHVFFLLQSTPITSDKTNRWLARDYGRLVEKVLIELGMDGKLLVKRVSAKERIPIRKDATNPFELKLLALQLAYNNYPEEQARNILLQTQYAKTDFLAIYFTLENVYKARSSLARWIKYHGARFMGGRPIRGDSSADVAFGYIKRAMGFEILQRRYLDWWSESDPPRETFTLFLHELVSGRQEGPDLHFSWIVNRPEDPVLNADGSYELHSVPHPFMRYEAVPGRFPDVLVATPILAAVDHSKFFDTVYGRYKNRIKDELIRVVKDVDAKLPLLRQAFGEVTDVNSGEILATVRIFDGTPRRIDDIYRKLDPATDDNFDLPFERAFKSRNIPLTHKRYLDFIRRIDPYQKIFEIGKLTLGGNNRSRQRALSLLEAWFLMYYVKRYPDAFFYAHVGSRAHLRLYKHMFGLDHIETISVPQAPDEFIMRVQGWELGVNLRASLKISWPKMVDTFWEQAGSINYEDDF